LDNPALALPRPPIWFRGREREEKEDEGERKKRIGNWRGNVKAASLRNVLMLRQLPLCRTY